MSQTAPNVLQQSLANTPGLQQAVENASGYDLGNAEGDFDGWDLPAGYKHLANNLCGLDLYNRNSGVLDIKCDLDQEVAFLPAKRFVNVSNVLSYLQHDPTWFAGQLDSITAPGGYIRFWAHGSELHVILHQLGKLGYTFEVEPKLYNSDTLTSSLAENLSGIAYSQFSPEFMCIVRKPVS